MVAKLTSLISVSALSLRIVESVLIFKQDMCCFRISIIPRYANERGKTRIPKQELSIPGKHRTTITGVPKLLY